LKKKQTKNIKYAVADSLKTTSGIVAIIFMATLGFLIIFLDLLNFGIYACGKKDTRNQGTNRKDAKINKKAKPMYLPTGGTK
jgi:hypothetical protein